MSLQTKPEEEGTENPFVLAVTIKDEHGNIDLGAIAEREYLFNTCRYLLPITFNIRQYLPLIRFNICQYLTPIGSQPVCC